MAIPRKKLIRGTYGSKTGGRRRRRVATRSASPGMHEDLTARTTEGIGSSVAVRRQPFGIESVPVSRSSRDSGEHVSSPTNLAGTEGLFVQQRRR